MWSVGDRQSVVIDSIEIFFLFHRLSLLELILDVAQLSHASIQLNETSAVIEQDALQFLFSLLFLSSHVVQVNSNETTNTKEPAEENRFSEVVACCRAMSHSASRVLS